MLFQLVAMPATANYNFIEMFWQESKAFKQTTCDGVICHWQYTTSAKSLNTLFLSSCLIHNTKLLRDTWGRRKDGMLLKDTINIQSVTTFNALVNFLGPVKYFFFSPKQYLISVSAMNICQDIYGPPLDIWHMMLFLYIAKLVTFCTVFTGYSE